MNQQPLFLLGLCSMKTNFLIKKISCKQVKNAGMNSLFSPQSTADAIQRRGYVFRYSLPHPNYL